MMKYDKVYEFYKLAQAANITKDLISKLVGRKLSRSLKNKVDDKIFSKIRDIAVQRAMDDLATRNFSNLTKKQLRKNLNNVVNNSVVSTIAKKRIRPKAPASSVAKSVAPSGQSAAVSSGAGKAVKNQGNSSGVASIGDTVSGRAAKPAKPVTGKGVSSGTATPAAPFNARPVTDSSGNVIGKQYIVDIKGLGPRNVRLDAASGNYIYKNKPYDRKGLEVALQQELANTYKNPITGLFEVGGKKVSAGKLARHLKGSTKGMFDSLAKQTKADKTLLTKLVTQRADLLKHLETPAWKTTAKLVGLGAAVALVGGAALYYNFANQTCGNVPQTNNPEGIPIKPLDETPVLTRLNENLNVISNGVKNSNIPKSDIVIKNTEKIQNKIRQLQSIHLDPEKVSAKNVETFMKNSVKFAEMAKKYLYTISYIIDKVDDGDPLLKDLTDSSRLIGEYIDLHNSVAQNNGIYKGASFKSGLIKVANPAAGAAAAGGSRLLTWVVTGVVLPGVVKIFPNLMPAKKIEELTSTITGFYNQIKSDTSFGANQAVLDEFMAKTKEIHNNAQAAQNVLNEMQQLSQKFAGKESSVSSDDMEKIISLIKDNFKSIKTFTDAADKFVQESSKVKILSNKSQSWWREGINMVSTSLQEMVSSVSSKPEDNPFIEKFNGFELHVTKLSEILAQSIQPLKEGISSIQDMTRSAVQEYKNEEHTSKDSTGTPAGDAGTLAGVAGIADDKEEGVSDSAEGTPSNSKAAVEKALQDKSVDPETKEFLQNLQQIADMKF